MPVFWILIIVSIPLIGSFYWGVKKNTKMARLIAEKLEEIFEPRDQMYTWLGGSIGFAADYKVKDFNKIYVNLRLIPRHSILWLPFSLLLGRRDSLQILFYLKNNINQEFHIVKKGLIMPKIYNKEKLKSFEDENFVYFYQFDPDWKEKTWHVCQELTAFLKHVAITPDKNIFYLELIGNLLDKKLWKGLKRGVEKLKTFPITEG